MHRLRFQDYFSLLQDETFFIGLPHCPVNPFLPHFLPLFSIGKKKFEMSGYDVALIFISECHFKTDSYKLHARY
jgi:hypothetical protein